MVLQPLGNPLLFIALGFRIHPYPDASAQGFFKADASAQVRLKAPVKVSVATVTHEQPVTFIPDHKGIGSLIHGLLEYFQVANGCKGVGNILLQEINDDQAEQ